MEPIVIDDFIPEIYIDSIYHLMGGGEITWTFHKHSTSSDPEGLRELFYAKEPTAEHLQFRHTFIEENKIKSPHLHYLAPLIACYENHFGKIKSTQRIKANLLVPQAGTTLQRAHADDLDVTSYDSTGYIGNKKTLLYYVNSSDGETVIYNEKFNGQPIGELTVKQTVEAVKGRAIIFDANQLHSACIPTNKRYRIIINSIFEMK
jgi:hypothetical protein